MEVQPLIKQDHQEFTITQLPREQLHQLDALNYELFRERRIINRTNHELLIILVARLHDIPVGFKIGYGRKNNEFYSAKGGVLPRFRRRKLASRMLDLMMEQATQYGYRSFVYDTFPNKHSGMALLGFQRGFRLIDAKYNARYSDYQLTLQKRLTPGL
ncbi:MAG: GNAT family N-acetyltransferase [Cyclonatronaceae bacterium]